METVFIWIGYSIQDGYIFVYPKWTIVRSDYVVSPPLCPGYDENVLNENLLVRKSPSTKISWYENLLVRKSPGTEMS